MMVKASIINFKTFQMSSNDKPPVIYCVQNSYYGIPKISHWKLKNMGIELFYYLFSLAILFSCVEIKSHHYPVCAPVHFSVGQ